MLTMSKALIFLGTLNDLISLQYHRQVFYSRLEIRKLMPRNNIPRQPRSTRIGNCDPSLKSTTCKHWARSSEANKSESHRFTIKVLT